MISNNYPHQASVWQLHDGIDIVDAMVASGDCFITLATQLDQITLITEHTPGHDLLEEVIKSLIDLQHRYKIIPKKPTT